MSDKTILDGVKIRHLRERGGLFSQSDLAHATIQFDPHHAGVGARLVWDAENGHPVTKRTWHLLARTLGVEPAELLESSPQRPRRARPMIASAFIALVVVVISAAVYVHGRQIPDPAIRPALPATMRYDDMRNVSVLRQSLALTHDLLCRNLTIARGITLDTRGHSIICTGIFENHGVIVTGSAPYGNYPYSYGGSGGGGGASCTGIGGQTGYNTLAHGGEGFLKITNGGSAPVPVLSTRLLQRWYVRGMNGYLTGAGGGGNPLAKYTGTPGAFGLYLQAKKIVAGRIIAVAPGACVTSGCHGADAAAGGGGGAIVLAYGAGGLVAGEYDVSGGRGNPGGCYPSGNGGDGKIRTFYFVHAPPIVPPAPKHVWPRVLPKSGCQDTSRAAIINNTRGMLTIISGTDSFASISPRRKWIEAPPNTSLHGRFLIDAVSRTPPFSHVSFVGTPSWGDARLEWFTIAATLPAGASSYAPRIHLTLPRRPGTYALIFAFQSEPSGSFVAAGTDWGDGPARWDTGNALAKYRSAQIDDAQTFGCAIVRRTVRGGSIWQYVPSDVVRLIVK